MPYGITQCYLPLDRDENPAFTHSSIRYSISDSGGMQGRVDLCYVKADQLGIEPARDQRPTAAPPRSTSAANCLHVFALHHIGQNS